MECMSFIVVASGVWANERKEWCLCNLMRGVWRTEELRGAGLEAVKFHSAPKFEGHVIARSLPVVRFQTFGEWVQLHVVPSSTILEA
jgi:hypothetical protein